ncbi:DUF3024 domain-containing protein [Denitromonas iodatirespirans]|uniref:DUF3024 domain-containing protein n=1 Tax=Denitromonas iodatirespirans TaxID=2795389 RepID=A0A944DQQ8_DENI1|nr:DUF3024 domain-containing protein [Denitromonas iodatirespirans]MBT0962869.1 DUF3024 domain-containing protein [Denitromonas iodatirespirans]
MGFGMRGAGSAPILFSVKEGNTVALSELETARLHKRVGAYVEARRPPPHVRRELDLSYRVSGQSFELFEVRQAWRGAPGETIEHPIVKATFVKTVNAWRIYWQRADLRWHRYEPYPTARTIDEVLSVIETDEYGCFYG